MIRDFGEIVALAARRMGGLPLLKQALVAAPALPPPAITSMPEDRVLAEMTRWIFGSSSFGVDHRP
ncbi:hypothetical protein [Methylobacterium fujisawaense]|uniref:hypothetical protein n=1 Tax=Methylobacterium fujisawaense TaxID=107400 RepID=UPI00313E4E4D